MRLKHISFSDNITIWDIWEKRMRLYHLTQLFHEAGAPAHCPSCGGEVYRGEKLFRYGGEYICAECLRDSVRFLSAEEMARFGDLKVQICDENEVCERNREE